MIDKKNNLIIPGRKEKTIDFLANYIIDLAKKEIVKKDKFSICLSGGNTPLLLYRAISEKPYCNMVDWKKVYVFWGDERPYPKDDTRNNFYMAMGAGIKKLSIPKENIFRMIAEKEISINAKKYEENIKKVTDNNMFDLVLLGLGEDGHIASLFPKSNALLELDRLVVENYIEKLDQMRMTITYRCINNSQNIIIFVLGKDKQNILEKIFIDRESFPVTSIDPKHENVKFVCDIDSSENIYI
jgi:6-phosphogluconolactonase